MSLFWAPVVLVAAAAQTARNATQSGLTRSIGAAGATQVRFLYGLPFGLAFLGLACFAAGAPPPAPGRASLAFALVGAVAQIGATALMLLAMQRASFTVTTALIKAEPLLVAIGASIMLADPLNAGKIVAILLAVLGVMILGSTRGSAGRPAGSAIALGLAAAALFGVSAIGFRGAITHLPDAPFWLRASTILALSLIMQSALLGGYLVIFNRAALLGSLSVWRQSLLVGFLGAFASQFWFLGFSLTSAANVRTLALIEVPMAQLLSRRLFRETLTARQGVGLALLIAGLALLFTASA